MPRKPALVVAAALMGACCLLTGCFCDSLQAEWLGEHHMVARLILQSRSTSEPRPPCSLLVESFGQPDFIGTTSEFVDALAGEANRPYVREQLFDYFTPGGAQAMRRLLGTVPGGQEPVNMGKSIIWVYDASRRFERPLRRGDDLPARYCSYVYYVDAGRVWLWLPLLHRGPLLRPTVKQ